MKNHAQLNAEARAESLSNYRQSELELYLYICSVEDSRTCEAVKSIDGILYEVDNVPTLPVDGCNAKNCRCVYLAKPKGFCFDDEELNEKITAKNNIFRRLLNWLLH